MQNQIHKYWVEQLNQAIGMKKVGLKTVYGQIGKQTENVNKRLCVCTRTLMWTRKRVNGANPHPFLNKCDIHQNIYQH